MSDHIKVGNLSVAEILFDFVNESVLPDAGVKQETFWAGFDQLIHDLSPKNRKLLLRREELQSQINDWHLAHRDKKSDKAAYKKFLADIGYLVPEGPDFSVGTENVDSEIAAIAGPQLVVPVSNARYALNAANSRWGSLYDALYGTDAIAKMSDIQKDTPFDYSRGNQVIGWVRRFLNEIFPLNSGSHADAKLYSVRDERLNIELLDGSLTQLREPEKFCGYTGVPDFPSSILLRNHGLHIEVKFDSEHFIGKIDSASISDVLLESAITTIIDFEDSIAAVDVEDKVFCYNQWRGLMKGTLTAEFTKAGKLIQRGLNRDKLFCRPNGETFQLHGRSLMLVRNVGHLMLSDAIIDNNNSMVPEGILDAMITSVIGMIDLKGNEQLKNSRAGSIYIVKPKMHGPDEVAFSDELFSRVENVLGLNSKTIKMGIMDEERRTTVNLKECIRAAKDRVVFINTGFLDRTGDEIFTSMEAGPMVEKSALKETPWIQAYEDWNVDIGLACGLKGRAQIGKGMWPKPDMMAEMLANKVQHPQAGANTAWVPSPTAATLHSVHYHQVDVSARQEDLKERKRADLNHILTVPLSDRINRSKKEIEREIENNAQGILGYVVRWVDQGIGCSKVPDINDTGLMEDRATLRISSQHIANWLHHGICTEDQVMETMKRMAIVVDKQNSGDPEYKKIASDFGNNLAFKAACDLVFLGRKQPSGYTEPILHSNRLEAKKHKTVNG